MDIVVLIYVVSDSGMYDSNRIYIINSSVLAA